MIRPLRQRHRVIVCALGVLLPVAFTAGIAARKPVPIAPSVSSALLGGMDDPGQVVWTKPDLWPGQKILTTLRRDVAGAVAMELVLADLKKPDVLVYWCAGQNMAIERLPDNARLLGALDNRRLLFIPPGVRGETGRFVLYSLADHEIVAASNAFIIQPD